MCEKNKAAKSTSKEQMAATVNGDASRDTAASLFYLVVWN